MKRLTVLLVATLSLLAASSSFAGYVDTSIVLDKTGDSLRVAGGAYHSNAGFSITNPSLTNGSYSFTIDANSDESALTYLGNLLCRDFGNNIFRKLRLDPAAMIFQGGPAGLGAGHILVKESRNGFVAILVPATTPQVYQFSCK